MPTRNKLMVKSDVLSWSQTLQHPDSVLNRLNQTYHQPFRPLFKSTKLGCLSNSSDQLVFCRDWPQSIIVCRLDSLLSLISNIWLVCAVEVWGWWQHSTHLNHKHHILQHAYMSDRYRSGNTSSWAIRWGVVGDIAILMVLQTHSDKIRPRWYTMAFSSSIVDEMLCLDDTELHIATTCVDHRSQTNITQTQLDLSHPVNTSEVVRLAFWKQNLADSTMNDSSMVTCLCTNKCWQNASSSTYSLSTGNSNQESTARLHTTLGTPLMNLHTFSTCVEAGQDWDSVGAASEEFFTWATLHRCTTPSSQKLIVCFGTWFGQILQTQYLHTPAWLKSCRNCSATCLEGLRNSRK